MGTNQQEETRILEQVAKGVYLQELKIRHKWNKGEHFLRPGVVVHVRDDNLPSLQWRLGRIIEVYEGNDKVIRTAKIKTANGEIMRNVKRLAPLPGQ